MLPVALSAVMENMHTDLGRGPRATQDMKNRIAALKASGADVIDELWARFRRAEVFGEGYEYDYAEQGPGQVRPLCDRSQ